MTWLFCPRNPRLSGDLDCRQVLAVLVAKNVPRARAWARGAPQAPRGGIRGGPLLGTAVLHRDAADAGGPKLLVGRVDHVGAAEALVARLFPLGY